MPTNSYREFFLREARNADNQRWEKSFALQLRAHEIKDVEFNIRDWHPSRRLELDVAVRTKKVGLEIQGGVFGQAIECNRCGAKVTRVVRGRQVPVREALGHGTGTGLKRDYEKIIAAQLLGWILLPVTPEMVEDGTAINLFLEALKQRSTVYP